MVVKLACELTTAGKVVWFFFWWGPLGFKLIQEPRYFQLAGRAEWFVNIERHRLWSCRLQRLCKSREATVLSCGFHSGHRLCKNRTSYGISNNLHTFTKTHFSSRMLHN